MTSSKGLQSYCECTRPAECIDRQPGRYLTAMYWLTTDYEGRLTTSRLSEHLDVSPASVTEMIQRLSEANLVSNEKYEGSKLTEYGETIAQELAWRQCIVRSFFATAVNLELDADTSYRIGYSISTAGIRRLRKLVDHPSSDDCDQRTCRHDSCLYGSRVTG